MACNYVRLAHSELLYLRNEASVGCLQLSQFLSVGSVVLLAYVQLSTHSPQQLCTLYLIGHCNKEKVTHENAFDAVPLQVNKVNEDRCIKYEVKDIIRLHKNIIFTVNMVK